MKYLHSGYILFCKEAEHADDGTVNLHGMFDLFVERALPIKMDCTWVIGFGTPFERRQYKGLVTVENPDGEEILRKEFSANDPADIYKGHYIFRPKSLSLKKACGQSKLFSIIGKTSPSGTCNAISGQC